MNGFACCYCKAAVSPADRITIGTKHRDHCPFCLWSIHLDIVPGDRNAQCGGKMQPIGITFKKQGRTYAGEPMIVYQCLKCGMVHKNRVAADDKNEAIIVVYQRSLQNQINQSIALGERLSDRAIVLADASKATLLLTRLFGKGMIPLIYQKQFNLL